MEISRQLAIRALQQMRGDNLERATAAFRGMTPAQMSEEYGQSGQTRRAILDEYQKERADIDAAIQWVKNAK